MRIIEIEDYDVVIWKTITGNDFRIDYQNLKRRHMLLSSNYNDSTQRHIVQTRLDSIAEMLAEIMKMTKFCKNSHDDTETIEFLKGLRSMYNDCKLMIEELKKHL